MLRLPNWRRPFARAPTSGFCVLVFPDSTESRWFDRVPTPSTRLRSHGGDFYWGRTYVIDEVLQSGKDTYRSSSLTGASTSGTSGNAQRVSWRRSSSSWLAAQTRPSMRHVGDGSIGTTCRELAGRRHRPSRNPFRRFRSSGTWCWATGSSPSRRSATVSPSSTADASTSMSGSSQSRSSLPRWSTHHATRSSTGRERQPPTGQVGDKGCKRRLQIDDHGPTRERDGRT